jgi:hypothetical protein
MLVSVVSGVAVPVFVIVLDRYLVFLPLELVAPQTFLLLLLSLLNRQDNA